MSAFTEIIRRVVEEALARLRLPANRIDNQLSGSQVAPASATDPGTLRASASAGQVIYAGVTDPLTLAGDAGLTYNATTNTLSVDTVQWALSPTATGAAEGRMYWDSTTGTINVGMPGGSVNLQVGQETLVRVQNDSGGVLANGDVVYVSGSSGTNIQVKKAKADAEATSSTTFAVMTEAVGSNQHGYATAFGLIHDLDTNAYTAGTVLYLSPTTAGALTSTKPTAPSHAVAVCTVVRKSATVGEVFVSINNGWELAELHDVLISSIQAGQTLTWNAAGYWVNSALNLANASAITGDLPDINLSANVPLLNAANIYTAIQSVGDGSTSAAIVINGAAGQVRDIAYRSGGSNRWFIRVSNTAETGGDAGSNFQIISRTDAGGAKATNISIDRATGAVTIIGAVAITGALTATSGAVSAADQTKIDAYPAVSGLTAGQVLRATGATAVGYGAVDLANASAITGDLPDTNLSANVPLLNAANIYTAKQRVTLATDADGTVAFEVYGTTTRRSYIDNYGAQAWVLNAGTGEVGSISYGTPGGVVALLLRDTTPIRADIRFLAGGGLVFATSATNSPSEALRIEDTRTVLIGKASGLTGAGELDVAGAIHGDKHIELIEITAPAAPAANGVRIYAEDNGAGKTRLMALFSSGVAQQIAIQP